MEVVATKILVAFLFGVLRFFFGILPFKLYKVLLHWEGHDDKKHFVNKKRHQQVTCMLALAQSFGGGVLFATCFLHMMPEVYKSVELLKKYGNLNTDFPLSQLIISLGFFLVYFVEEFSHWFITKVPEVPYREDGCKLKNRAITPLSNQVSPIKEKEAHNSVEARNERNREVDQVEVLNQQNLHPFIIENGVSEKNLEKALEAARGTTVTIDSNEYIDGEGDASSLNAEVVKDDDIDKSEEGFDIEEEEPKPDTKIEKEVKTKQQVVRYILVVCALSFHAVFEGLAIGIQTSIPNIWYLFIAVSIHSATILFYISMELLLARTKRRTIIIHVVTLTVTNPIGVLLGLLITLRADMDTKAKSTAVVFLEGLSAGTLLYITFFEILNREKERRIYRFRRGVCIIMGFGMMALLQLIEVPMR